MTLRSMCTLTRSPRADNCMNTLQHCGIYAFTHRSEQKRQSQMYAALSLLLCSVHTYEYSFQRCTHKQETNTLLLLHTQPSYRVTLAVAQQMVRLLPSSRLHSLAVTAGSCVTALSKSRAHGAIHTASCCTMHGGQAVNLATGALQPVE